MPPSRRRGLPPSLKWMPSASSAAGNLDNRRVEIVCAASAHVNVSVFYQPLTPPTGLGLLALAPRRVSFPIGQRVARSLPERWPAVAAGGSLIGGSRPSTRA